MHHCTAYVAVSKKAPTKLCKLIKHNFDDVFVRPAKNMKNSVMNSIKRTLKIEFSATIFNFLLIVNTCSRNQSGWQVQRAIWTDTVGHHERVNTSSYWFSTLVCDVDRIVQIKSFQWFSRQKQKNLKLFSCCRRVPFSRSFLVLRRWDCQSYVGRYHRTFFLHIHWVLLRSWIMILCLDQTWACVNRLWPWLVILVCRSFVEKQLERLQEFSFLVQLCFVEVLDFQCVRHFWLHFKHCMK